jgi:sterol 3beta-glucosyltransferase
MAPEDDLKKRVGRKLTKRRKEGHQATMEIPERFRDGEDADEDCTAPQGTKAYLNQSVFGMIAAAGSQVDFNARFDGQSSDDEDDTGQPSSQSAETQVAKSGAEKPASKVEKHRRKFSEHKFLRMPRLGSKSESKSSSKSESPSSSPPDESPAPDTHVSRMPSRDAPVMSRMLEAKAELSMRPSFDLQRLSSDRTLTDDTGEQTSSLAKRLMDIFQFDKAEDVIEGWFYTVSSERNADKIRISLLAFEECFTTRLYVHYNETYLLLCIPT